MAESARQAKGAHEAQTLLASAARTVTTGTGGTAIRLPVAQGYAFVLDVTNAATDADDTLDVYVQTKLDGTNWVDVVHFTQVLGNGADAIRFVSKIAPSAAQAEFNNATALGAAAVRHLAGDEWRAYWVVVDPSGDNATFTFSVAAIPF